MGSRAGEAVGAFGRAVDKVGRGMPDERGTGKREARVLPGRCVGPSMLGTRPSVEIRSKSESLFLSIPRDEKAAIAKKDWPNSRHGEGEEEMFEMLRVGREAYAKYPAQCKQRSV